MLRNSHEVLCKWSSIGTKPVKNLINNEFIKYDNFFTITNERPGMLHFLICGFFV